jgi:hypothetical protein
MSHEDHPKWLSSRMIKSFIMDCDSLCNIRTKAKLSSILNSEDLLGPMLTIYDADLQNCPCFVG